MGVLQVAGGSQVLLTGTVHVFVSFFSCLGLCVDLLVLKFTLGASLLLTPSYRRIKVVKLKLEKKKSGRGKRGHCLSTHMVECENAPVAGDAPKAPDV